MVISGLAGFFCTLLPMFTISTEDIPGLPRGLTGRTPLTSGGALAQASSVSVDIGFYNLGVTWFGALALPVALIVFACIGAALLRRRLPGTAIAAAALLGGLALLVAVAGLIRTPVTTVTVVRGVPLSDAVAPNPGAGLIIALVAVAAGIVLSGAAAWSGPRN